MSHVVNSYKRQIQFALQKQGTSYMAEFKKRQARLSGPCITIYQRPTKPETRKDGAIRGRDGDWRMLTWPDGRERTQWELGLED